jgi:hypothetical protein
MAYRQDVSRSTTVPSHSNTAIRAVSGTRLGESTVQPPASSIISRRYAPVARPARRTVSRKPASVAGDAGFTSTVQHWTKSLNTDQLFLMAPSLGCLTPIAPIDG